MCGSITTGDDGPMPYFFVEIHMSGAGRQELDRAARTLEVAKTRLPGTGTATCTVVAVLIGDDARLVCVIDATTVEVVQHLVTLALLPAGRIREISHPSCRA
jgi:hypothetical protein